MDNTKINDTFLNVLYDDLATEVRTLGNSMRNGSSEIDDKDIHRQITILTNMMNHAIKLRNIRRKIRDKL